jgi:glycosyltransferase involved in cell wall biosynthesis
MSLKLSLVIPVFNESETIALLISSIKNQSFQPAEVILVDGGSTDNTVAYTKQLTADSPAFRIIEAGRAMPGKGRNIGVMNANNDWIVFTDAGITLDKHWIENLVKRKERNPEAAVIYGNFSPQLNSFFDKCATISYVPPLIAGKIRTKSIASCLLKKEVWQVVGGFPDWRAAEDLVFMENIEKAGFKIAEAPDAWIYWQLRPTLSATFTKFELYSMYNVWAGKQSQWHYGIARQYVLMLSFVILAFFHSCYWLLALPLWIGLRVAKRVWSHRQQFGNKAVIDPAIFFRVMLITLVTDAATFSGWIKALRNKPASV